MVVLWAEAVSYKRGTPVGLVHEEASMATTPSNSAKGSGFGVGARRSAKKKRES